MSALTKFKQSPWAWVPTLYFAEGIPYFIVNNISVLMLAKMGVPNGQMALFTSLLYLPWTIKPFWSPFVDIIRTKRWWVIAMQVLMSIAFILLTLAMPHPDAATIASGKTPISIFYVTLLLFSIAAFASATHDIAADGFYMLALTQKNQAAFVGIRSTFYRLSSIFGQGVLVYIAGRIETSTGDIPYSWRITLLVTAVLFCIITLYHTFFIPKPSTDVSSLAKDGKKANASQIFTDLGVMLILVALIGLIIPYIIISLLLAKIGIPIFKNYLEKGADWLSGFSEFGRTFVTFCKKPGIWLAIVFMLLYRLPEAFLIKMCTPFLVAAKNVGGLGLSTEGVGIVYGTIGVLFLTIGGILGGIYASKVGLKKSLWWMAACMTLPCLTFVYLAIWQPDSIINISIAVAIEQFGYGFGFTAYMLYMIYFSEGEFKTSHYAICTAFMALSMMIPGMFAGYIQEAIGYVNFFWMVIACCVATLIVTFLVDRKIDPEYGLK